MALHMPTSRSTRLLLSVALLVVVGLVADGVWGANEPARTATLQQDPPSAGTWYCPGAVGGDERATLSVAAVGDGPSIVTVERYPEGVAVADPPVQLTAGDQLDVALPPGHATAPLRVRWIGRPAVASWRLEGGDAASANCAAAPAPVWYLTGLDTQGGARSFVHLFNPSAVDAVARVVFGTPQGRVALVLTDNVLVPAGRTVRLALNDYQPEQLDLAVTVDVLSGRIVAMGEVFNQNGRALVEAVPQAAMEHAFAFGKSDGGTTSWVSIYNPSEAEAAVDVRVSDPRPEVPDSGEITIPPGGVVRVQLAERSLQADYGVAVSSLTDEPVVVVRGTSVRTSSGRMGFALSASRGTSRIWALPGGGTTARQARISLYNPTGEAVTVHVRTARGGLPDWEAIPLPPNGRASLQLEAFAPGMPSLLTMVEASGAMVAELRLVDEVGTLRLWTAPGVPAADWTGPPRRPSTRRDPGLAGKPLPLGEGS